MVFGFLGHHTNCGTTLGETHLAVKPVKLETSLFKVPFFSIPSQISDVNSIASSMNYGY